MTLPLVSIIIPVYNAEQCIASCLESVLNQSYPSCEAIAIDDGSNDSSWVALEQLQKAHPDKIHIHHQENKGVAITRNLGLSLANGDFVLFLDADDTIDSDYVEQFASVFMYQMDVDIVCAGYRRIMADGSIVDQSIPQSGTEWAPYLVPAVCSKLYRTDFLRKNEITFQNLRIGEDICFTLTALNHASHISIVESCGYNYLYNSEGASSSFLNSTNTTDFDFLLETLVSQFKSVRADSALSSDKTSQKTSQASEMSGVNVELEYHFIVRLIVWYISMSSKSVDELRFKIVRYRSWLDKIWPDWKNDSYARIRKPKGDKLVNRLATWIFVRHQRLFIFLLSFRLRWAGSLGGV